MTVEHVSRLVIAEQQGPDRQSTGGPVVKAAIYPVEIPDDQLQAQSEAAVVILEHAWRNDHLSETNLRVVLSVLNRCWRAGKKALDP